MTLSKLAKSKLGNLYADINPDYKAFFADIELINNTKHYADYRMTEGILDSATGYAFAKFIIEADELTGGKG